MQLDPDIKKQWVKALRSGDYKQGKGVLYQVTARGTHRFCCLGVLAHIADPAPWERVDCNGRYRFRPANSGNSAGLTQAFCADVGLSNPVELARMNDDGKSFKYLANYIENNL